MHAHSHTHTLTPTHGREGGTEAWQGPEAHQRQAGRQAGGAIHSMCFNVTSIYLSVYLCISLCLHACMYIYLYIYVCLYLGFVFPWAGLGHGGRSTFCAVLSSDLSWEGGGGWGEQGHVPLLHCTALLCSALSVLPFLPSHSLLTLLCVGFRVFWG